MVRGFDLRGLRSVPIIALALALVLSTVMVFSARGSSHGETYWACLFGGSLSQVGTSEPANCGRGTKISWNAEGVEGQAGASGFEWVEVTYTIPFGGDAANFGNYTLDCPDGKVAVAGGFQPSNRQVEIMSSFPGTPDSRWVVRARNTHVSTDQELTVYVSCIDAPVVDPV